MKAVRRPYSEEEDQMCIKHYRTLGPAGIIEAGYIQGRSAKCLSQHCREILGLTCDMSIVNSKAQKKAVASGSFITPHERTKRKRSKGAAPEPVQEKKPASKWSGVSSIFALGAA